MCPPGRGEERGDLWIYAVTATRAAGPAISVCSLPHAPVPPRDALRAMAQGRALHPACPGRDQAVVSMAVWNSLKPLEDQNQGQICCHQPTSGEVPNFL